MITHLFFDVGGVLGSNGWDRTQRAEGARRFGLDLADFERRHHELVGGLEIGELTLDEYLDGVVFHRPRGFTREEFTAFMREQSVPVPEAVALARACAGRGYHVMTLNNESAELNEYRLRHFGLLEFCDAFLSSCWLGVRKPAPLIYERALQISQADAAAAVFIDDREGNLAPARALGMRVIRFTGVPALAAALEQLGVTT